MKGTYIKWYITELRYRIVYLFIGYIFFIIIAYINKEYILYIVTLHYRDYNVYFTYSNIYDVINVYIRIIFSTSILILVILFIINVCIFIIPGLYRYELIRFILLFISIFIYTILALVIIYNLLTPVIFKYFQSITMEQSITLFSFQSNFFSLWSFLKIYYIYLLLGFLTYLIITILQIYHILYKDSHINRKYIYVLYILTISILNPGDLYSQLLISILLFIVNELTIIVIYIIYNYIYNIK